MITPGEIVKRAERKYRDVLRMWLAGEDYVSIEFPVGNLSPDLAQRREQIDLLREASKEECGTGYTLDWETIKTHSVGKQTVPRRVTIPTLEDYLSLIRKKTEFQHFTADVLKIRQSFPALMDWLYAYPQQVIDHHGSWEDLLAVCTYFTQNPRPNLYIRELPIPVHTKFIEENQRILRDLLDLLLPSEAIHAEAQDFNRRFGLKDKPALVRLRLLEEQLDWSHGIKVDDVSLPIEQAAHLLSRHLKPRHVVIVENLINFLTLPKLPNSIGLFGGGFAVHLLREVHWLNQCDIVYWGDIDAHGFQILSDLRGIFPHTRSVMMDRATFDAYAQYATSGKHHRSQHFDYLTAAEAFFAQEVAGNDWRLEQERLPQVFTVACLRQVLVNY